MTSKAVILGGICVGIFGGFFTSVQTASGAVVAYYRVNTATNNGLPVTDVSNFTSIDTEVGSSADTLTGVGVTIKTTGNQYSGTSNNASGSLYFESSELTSTAPTTPPSSAGDFVTFTVTPDSGNALTYTSFQFDIAARTTIAAPNVATSTGYVYSSADNYSSVLGSGSRSINGNGATQTSGATVSFALANMALITEPTTFRIYFTSSNAARSYVDNIIVDAEVTAAVPEPASLGLLAAAGGLLLGRRRR